MSSPSPPRPIEYSETSLSWKSLRQSCWLYPLAVCLLLLLLFSAKRIGSHDLGTHLRAGQWILQNHSFPGKDTFTYTQTNRDYLDPHGLFQVVVYALQNLLGYASLTLMNMILLLGVFWILFLRLKTAGSSDWLTCLMILAALLMTERRFAIRPEIFTWFYLSLTLLILELRAAGRNFLFLLPWIQLFWVNTEGLFILGLFATGVYGFSGWLHQKKWDPKLIQFGWLSLGADLVNPYFLKGLLFPFVLFTRLQNDNLYKQTIVEFFSPWKYLQTQKFIYDYHVQIFLFFIFFLTGLFLILAAPRKWKAHELLLFAAFAWLSFSGVRNIPLFALAALPLLSAHLRQRAPRGGPDWVSGKKTPLILAFLLCLLASRVATGAYYTNDRRADRLGLTLDENRLPVKACQFLNQKNLRGRVLNDLGFGGWINWNGLQPSFMDGRLEVMEDDFYREYSRSVYEKGLDQLILKYQPDLIFAEYNASYGWISQLRGLPLWRLIYLDECAAIYAREGYRPDIPALSFPSLLSERQIPAAKDDVVLRVLGESLPSRAQIWFEGCYRFQGYPMGLSSMGLYCLRAGQYQEARDLFYETLHQAGAGYEEIYFNLGVAYLHLQNFSLGRLCLEKALQLNPRNPSTRQMLDSLGSR